MLPVGVVDLLGMTVGTPFFDRQSERNTKLAWGEWSGYLAAATYADSHEIEYNAIRQAAAVIDVSPLYKYELTGADAQRLVDRVITRDATKIEVGQVVYTPWCDERGKVIDDGTVARLDDSTFRWTAADPQYRWLQMNAAELDVEITDVSEALGALALQGPRARAVLAAATGEEWEEVRYFRRRSSSIAGVEIDVTRTGYTGDLGYELFIPAKSAADVWDALFEAGVAHGLRPAGMRALDIVRLEAGLILIEVVYTSVKHAEAADHEYSPFEIGLGRLVSFTKGPYVGRAALAAERDRGGPRRRLAGIEIEWEGIESEFARHDLAPHVSPVVDRSPVPIFAGRRQVGRATSTGWSPTLKKMIGLASLDAEYEPVGSRLQIEWTVEGERGRIPARVVELPFLDLERKRG
jgi:glycine cleavage system T protein (aminomethyltransferase)